MKRLAPIALALGLLAGGPAHAGLFDDEEARKAILDLRQRLAASDERSIDNRKQIDALAASNKQLGEELAALRRGLLDINNQLELMRADAAKARGSSEQLARDVAELQRGQRDATQALEDRLRRIEPVKVAVDGREFLAEPDEKKAYEAAIGTLRAGEFDKSVAALSAFQRRWPASGYADSVRFWLGNALYGKRDYKEALTTFRGFVAAAPDHPRAPEALLALANTQAEMKDTKTARRTIEELLKTYPQSEAAVAGKERLVSLK